MLLFKIPAYLSIKKIDIWNWKFRNCWQAGVCSELTESSQADISSCFVRCQSTDKLKIISFSVRRLRSNLMNFVLNLRKL